MSATAFYFALATLLIFLPTQLITEGNLTTMSKEVKAILAMAAIALVTIPIARLELYQKFGPGLFFAGLAVMMVVAAAVFSVVGKRFQRGEA